LRIGFKCIKKIDNPRLRLIFNFGISLVELKKVEPRITFFVNRLGRAAKSRQTVKNFVCKSRFELNPPYFCLFDTGISTALIITFNDKEFGFESRKTRK